MSQNDTMATGGKRTRFPVIFGIRRPPHAYGPLIGPCDLPHCGYCRQQRAAIEEGRRIVYEDGERLAKAGVPITSIHEMTKITEATRSQIRWND